MGKLGSAFKSLKTGVGLKKIFITTTGLFFMVFVTIGQTATNTSLTTSKNPACDNNTITFTATISPDVSNNGTVEFFDGPTSLGSNSVASSIVSLSTTLTAGAHSITAVFSGGGGFDPSTSSVLIQNITALSSLSVSAAPLGQTVCSGAVFNTIVFSGNATAYNWTRDNIDNLVGIDPAGPGGTTSIPGVLTNITTSQQTTVFTIGGIKDGCVSTVQASITVNPPPAIAAITSTSDNVCELNSVTFSSSPSGGVWSTSDNGVATVNSSGVVTGVSSGTAVITYTVTQSGCVGSVIKSINVNASPTATVTGTTTVCAGVPANITGVASISPPVTVSGSNNENTNSVQFLQHDPLSFLDKTIVVDLSAYGITSLSQVLNISVTVNVNHQRDQEVELYLIAPGGNTTVITPTPFNTANPSQNWTAGLVVPLAMHNGGPTANFVNTVFTDLAGQSVTAGIGSFTGSYRPFAALSSLNGTINPNGVWKLRMVDSWNTGFTGVYRSFSINFTLPGTGGGGGTVAWTSVPVDPTWIPPLTGNITFPVTPAQTTTYYLTSTALNGCTAVSSATVTVIPTLTADAGPDQYNCNNGSFTLAANSPAPGTGLWTVVSGTANITTPTSPTSSVTGVPVGTSATLRWTITSDPCSPPPNDVILTNNTPPAVTGITICQGDNGTVTATAICPPGGTPVSSTRFAGTGASSGSGAVWNNAGRVTANDNSNSTTGNIAANGGVSQSLNATNFGFGGIIPANAIIVGVQATIGRLASNTNSIQDNLVQLIVGGTPTGNNHALPGTWSTSEAATNYGTTSDLWSVPGGLTLAQVTASNFGLSLVVSNTAGSTRTASVDYVQLSVAYILPGIINWYTVSSGGSVVGSGNSFNPVPSVLPNTNTPGTYPFYAECSTTSGCRSAVANFIINPTPLQPADFTTQTTTVCPGASGIRYTVPLDNTVTYAWSTTGTGWTINGSTNSVTIDFSGTATSGTLSVTANNSCGASTARTTAITVGASAQPGAFTASQTSVCQGQNAVTYTVPNDASVTYNWSYSGSGATINGTSSSVTVDYSTTATSGTLSVTATNICGVSVPRSVAVTVNPIPQGSLAGNTICSGGTGQFTFTSSAGTGPFTLIIVDNITLIPVTYPGIVSGTPFNASPNPVVTRNYTLTSITDAGSCPRTTGITGAAATITLNSVPARPLAFTTSSASVCQGATGVVYTVPAVSGATSYLWTYPTGSGVTFNGTSNSVTADFSASATSGTVSVVAQNSCGNSIARTMPVTVNSLPTASTPSSTPTLCINTALTNITHTTTGATGIGVATGLPSGVSAAFSANTITISGTPTASGTFNYIIPLTGSCGGANATGTITVNPIVTPTFAAVGPYCSGATIPALPTTSTNGITGTWAPSINNTTTTLYTFTPTAGQCATTATLTITVNANVTPTFAAVGPYCSGATIPALPTTSTNGITGTWSPAINNTTTTLYTFTPTAGQCATTATLTITVNPNVTPTFAAVGPYCSGATIPALPTTSTNGITGTWSSFN